MESDHSKDPSIMAELFGKMNRHMPGFFTVRRLDMRGRTVRFPMPALRSPIHCFFFLTDGEALITIGEHSCFFKAGECATIPAGEFFAVRYFDGCAGYMGGFDSDYLSGGNDGRNLLNSFGFLRRMGQRKVSFDQRHTSYLENIFRRLYDEAEAGADKSIVKAYLVTLLTEIEAAWALVNSESGAHVTESALCNNFVELVFRDCDHGIALDRYAEHLSVSKNYLHKVVRRYTGKTPGNWIVEAVMLEAKALLCHTGMTVAEVAAAVGINDPSYFSRLFRKHAGQTPLHYRESSKNT